MKLYLSTQSHDPGKLQKQYDSVVNNVIASLKSLNFEIIWFPDWPGDYNIIEHSIAKSDCFLAIIDMHWTSGTWKATEITYASGQAGSGLTTNPSISSIPVFVIDMDKYPSTLIENLKNIIFLPKDNVKAATETIFKHMNAK